MSITSLKLRTKIGLIVALMSLPIVILGRRLQNGFYIPIRYFFPPMVNVRNIFFPWETDSKAVNAGRGKQLGPEFFHSILLRTESICYFTVFPLFMAC